MANPYTHSLSSAKIFGGTWEDYIKIHEKMDCQKHYVPDNRGRVLTHTPFWINEVMIPLFGNVLVNSGGRTAYVRDICLRHIQEDYHMKFIPTPQDFIENMEWRDWMNNGVRGMPASCKKNGGENG